MTGELLVLYLEAAGERLRGEYVQAVETARLGTIFGAGHKETNRAYQAWRRAVEPQGDSKGLTGAALEQAVASLALAHPEYIAHGTG